MTPAEPGASRPTGKGLDVDVRVRRDLFSVEIRFTADPGETICLLGPNGSGKSTVVAAVAGLLQPDDGRIALDGVTLDDASGGIHVRPQDRHLGVVFQRLLLFPHLSAVENVAFPLRAKGTGRREAVGRARALLEELHVAHRADVKPDRLSGGEAQRVAMARALVDEPRLLLLDEPLSALDVVAKGDLRALLRTTLANFGGVRVIVSHDPVEAMTLADRLIVIEAGRVTQAGSADELRRGPRTPYVAELVGLNLLTGRLEPLDEGAARLRTPDGDLVVVWPAAAAGRIGGVIALVRPADVSVALSEPAETSARNVLHGRVAALTLEGERARLSLDTHPPVVAEVTLGSVTRLGLTEGTDIWASFKAVEVTVVVP